MSSYPPPPRQDPDDPYGRRPESGGDPYPDGGAGGPGYDGGQSTPGYQDGSGYPSGAPSYPGDQGSGYQGGTPSYPGYQGSTPAYQGGGYEGGPGYYGQPPTQVRNGMGIAALIVGIVSLLIAWIPFVGLVGVVGGLVAVILGAIGVRRVSRREATNRGTSIAGIILGVLAILLGIVTTALGATFFAQFWNEDVQACVEQYTDDRTALEQCIQDAMR